MCYSDHEYFERERLREDAERAREQADRAMHAATAAERDALDARAERDATHRQYLWIRDELERVRGEHEPLVEELRELLRRVTGLGYRWTVRYDEDGAKSYALDTSEHRTGD